MKQLILKLNIKQLSAFDNDERYLALYLGIANLAGITRINTTSKYKINKERLYEYEN